MSRSKAVARRDIGQGWKKYYPWPRSYTQHIQYVWSRHQANICLFSPIHFGTPAQSIAAEDWNLAANGVIAQYGPPPFGTLAGTNSNPSSLRNWGHVARARWLGFHQIGNRRMHDVYSLLTEIFQARPPAPGINGEPYHDGMENLEGGSEASARFCRSAMYGSVLCGGLGGHVCGAGGWEGGLWSGEVVTAAVGGVLGGVAGACEVYLAKLLQEAGDPTDPTERRWRTWPRRPTGAPAGRIIQWQAIRQPTGGDPL